MLTARKRNNLVLIQHKLTYAGDFNDIVAWAEYAQVWVSIDPQRGRETYAGPELGTVVTHAIRGDWQELSGVTSEMRIIHALDMSYANDGGSPPTFTIDANARVFDVLAVMPDFEMRGDVMIPAVEKGLRYGDIASDVPQ